MSYILYFIWTVLFINNTSHGFRNFIIQYKHNTRYLDNVEKEPDISKVYRKNPGFDETYKKNETLDNELMRLIEVNFHKFALLKRLQSHNIREPEKIQLLNDDKHLFDLPSYAINIAAGGLCKDWDQDL